MKSAKDEFREFRGKGIRVHSKKPREKDAKTVRNLNSLLNHIYEVHDRPLRGVEFPRYFKVFQTVSLKLHDLMKQVDPYYERYSVVRFMGRKDRFRINKPDQFDMEIVIGLPVVDQGLGFPAQSVSVEEVAPAFVQVRIGEQFRNLQDRGQIMQTVYRWLDADNYVLRSLFMGWFKSIVDKALDLFDGNTIMEGQTYTLRLIGDISPTLTIEAHEASQGGFRLDMDLAPALELLEKDCNKMPTKLHKCRNIVVVPKPQQGSPGGIRSWRLPLKLEESDLLYMKQAIRLIKILRDSQGLKKISSYHLSTMFYHEAMVQDHDTGFWSKDVPARPFIHMVKKFHQHLHSKNIPYFWNEDINLIGDIDESTLDDYAKKLKRFIRIVEDPTEYKLVAKFLMTESQFKEYKKNILI